MNSKIKNPKTQVTKGIKLNDQDYISEALSYLKDLSKNYVIAMSEASNEKLFVEYESAFKEITNLQREVFEKMFANGWYELETVSNTKLNDKINQLNQNLESL